MTDNVGITQYPWWKSTDKVLITGLSGENTVVVNTGVAYKSTPPVVGYSDYNFCSFNESSGANLGVAWVSASGIYSMNLHAVYLTSDGLAVDHTYVIDICTPTDQFICAGMKQISKYVFRLLIGGHGAGLTWEFVDVDVYAGSVTVGNSYTFAPAHTGGGWNPGGFYPNYCRFYNSSRAGDLIFGGQVEWNPGNDSGATVSGVYVAGLVADLGTGTFGTLTTMLSFTDGASNTYDHQTYPVMTVSHNGEDGFNVRVFLLETYFSGAGWPSINWTINELKLTLFNWNSFTLTDQTGSGTVVGNISSSHHWFNVYGGRPTTAIPTVSEQDGATTPHNSYYWYEYVTALVTCQDGTPYSLTYNCAAPMTPGTHTTYGFTPDVTNRPLSETGAQLEYSGFEYQASGNHLYLVDYSSHSYSLISASGYDIRTVFNRLDATSGNILCWAVRSSDGWFGVLELTQGLAFVQFVAVAATAPAGYAGYALISNGFIVVNGSSNGTCYYIDGVGVAPTSLNTLAMLPEWN